MPSIERLSRFIVHSELKILDWVQTGKAHSEARMESTFWIAFGRCISSAWNAKPIKSWGYLCLLTN